MIAGLQAIDRLMLKPHTFSLAAGSLELDNLLNTANGMGTADVRQRHWGCRYDLNPTKAGRRYIGGSAGIEHRRTSTRTPC